ncbi:MAG: 2-phosphosulfolactate phosphatase [Bacteroidia bacterium]|nr:2-phosphosulfolactate phosphatase [Bacteroidia bacterium]
MKVEILEFVEGAKKAKGVTVIIDVFRAFSTACYAYGSGAVRLIATADAEKAFDLKKSYHHSVLTGERDEKKIKGFDFGNSPTEIIKSDLQGMTVILTTTAGTNGLINAEKANVVFAGSFVNCGAVVKYIKAIDPPLVSLVAMGYRATISAAEDLLCAEMIRAGLNDEPKDYQSAISDLRHGAGKRFFDPANLDFSPPTDFFLCTMADRFDFILKGEKRLDGNIDLVKIDL